MATNRLTVQEAGFLLDRASATINRAIDRDKVAAWKSSTGQRLLDFAAVRYLGLATDLDKTLTPQGRRQVYSAIKRLPLNVHRVTLGAMHFELKEIDQALETKVDRLKAVRGSVDHKAGQDPFLKHTTIPVHMIAALARGQSVDEIVEDFPSLSAEQVRAAIDYARAYPKVGRPYPERSFKRMLADAAQVGAFDPLPDDDDQDDDAPAAS